ncbi:unnamed protein product [Closterium sp. NIES-54]
MTCNQCGRGAWASTLSPHRPPGTHAPHAPHAPHTAHGLHGPPGSHGPHGPPAPPGPHGSPSCCWAPRPAPPWPPPAPPLPPRAVVPARAPHTQLAGRGIRGEGGESAARSHKRKHNACALRSV